MSVLHFARRRSLRAIAAATMLAGVLVVPAFASTATATVTGGTLGMTVGTLTAASDTLNGTNQTATFSIPVTADDATGSGAGWNLTMGATQFTGTGLTPPTLATNALAVSAAPVVSAITGTGPTNNVSIASPLTVSSTAVKYFNAAVNTGMGTSTETATMNVSIPANTVASTYTSTVTLAIVSAP